MLESSEAAEAHKRVERHKLESMLGFCELTTCRRQALLRYFGETLPEPCGNCDTCLEPVPTWDGTEAARKAMSCVYRTGQVYGANHLIDVLRGKDNGKVVAAGHNRLSVFGIGKELDGNQWRSVFRQLVARGLLTVDVGGTGVCASPKRAARFCATKRALSCGRTRSGQERKPGCLDARPDISTTPTASASGRPCAAAVGASPKSRGCRPM
ncbi:RQC domain-containing protein [Alkalilimnicola ehrlichii]|uniref:RQC domain-containing protein n=1 Tax=Alkalilimnicola ehrlichii TaxID=351052 RepID=UPI00384FD1A8